MSEQNNGVAGAAEQSASPKYVDINQAPAGGGMASLERFFGSKTETPEVAPEPAAPAETAPVETPPPGPSLAEVIKEQRIAREARQRAEAEAKSHETARQTAEAEAKRLREAPKFEDDPLTYAELAKLTPAQRVAYGEALIYSVVTEKAPPDLRWKLAEIKDARRKENEAAERAKQEVAQAEAFRAAQIETLHRTMVDHVTQVPPEAFPASADWFGDDHASRAASLVATAQNLANAAAQRGIYADLSPSAISAALEQEVARKVAAIDERRAARQPKAVATATKAAVPTQGTEGTMSTRGLGAGSPRPPAQTIEERVRRAAEAGWKR